jgi:hypothetical protein
MHSNIKFTDQFYSVLDSSEVQDKTNSLNTNDHEEIVGLLEGLFSKIKMSVN